MLRYITLLIFFLVNATAYTQILPGGSEGKSYSFRDEEEEDPGLYGAINLKVPNMAGDLGIELGASLGGYFSKHFSLGAEIDYLFTQTIKFELPGEEKQAHVRLVYGGPVFSAFLPAAGDFKLFGDAAFFTGHLSYGTHTSIDIADDPAGKWIFMWNASGGIEYKLSRGIFIGLSAGWRAPFSAEYKGLSAEDLSGMIIKIYLKNIM